MTAAPTRSPAGTRHVVLIGLMGSGKTTVGKKVARLLGRRFLDADVELEARTGRSVAAWFEHEGSRIRVLRARVTDTAYGGTPAGSPCTRGPAWSW